MVSNNRVIKSRLDAFEHTRASVILLFLDARNRMGIQRKYIGKATYFCDFARSIFLREMLSSFHKLFEPKTNVF